MGTGDQQLRIGIVGCGQSARRHAERLLAIERVTIVGCSDPEISAAESLANWAEGRSTTPIPSFADHRDLLKQRNPHALAVFTPHLAHYRPTVNALQAGCHVFVEKPLSTNVQEAVDIVGLARPRGRKVAVGHQYRLRPSLIEARRRIAAGMIGPIRLVTATLAQPWLSTHEGSENSWRFDPKIAAGGILADAGDHLLDAVLWTTGQVASEVAALQSKHAAGLDTVTAAAIRLADGTPVAMGISGVSSVSIFELTYHGEAGQIRVTDVNLEQQLPNSSTERVGLSESLGNIDSDFVSAVLDGTPLSCPAEEAVDTVRLLEAIARSATTRQIVPLA